MKTWKVLIADDEPIIREGIREAVDWQALQMEVIAEAEDGQEALELALLHTIDVLLVDLNMPIMDGITLMKHIREELPLCKLIIISGHDEFAYAQEAIRLDVDEYILKPADPGQLRHVLGNVGKDLATARKQSEHLEMASRQIKKNFPLLRERFCIEWIEGNLSEEEIMDHLHFLQLPTSPPDQIGVIHWPEVTTGQPLMKESDRQLFLFAIENIVSELLTATRNVIFRDHSGLIIICLWGELSESMFSDIEKVMQHYLKILINVHFTKLEGSLTQISEAYRLCKTNVFKESYLSPVVRRARQLMRQTFTDQEVTLETLAQELQVSPVYLSRMMKQELGTSFVTLMTQMRVNKAIQLLNTTDLSINDIAERVGYDTQHYFSTAFKKVIGVSPNQYRRGAAFQDES